VPRADRASHAHAGCTVRFECADEQAAVFERRGNEKTLRRIGAFHQYVTVAVSPPVLAIRHFQSPGKAPMVE
jgi:hypothetical protein